MATLDQLNAALIKADAEGNTDDAKVFASEIRRLRAMPKAQAEPPFKLTDPTTHGRALEAIAANPATQFAVGAGKRILGANQIINDAINSVVPAWPRGSGVNLEQLDEITKAGQERQTGAEKFTGQAAGFAGDVLSPLSLSLMKAKPAATYAGKVGQGAGIAALFGLTEPVMGEDQLEQRAKNTALATAVGGGFGAVASPLIHGTTAAINAVKQAFVPSPAHIANLAAGPQRDAVIKAMMEAKSGIPGLNLTAGQASISANSPEFAALQRLVASREPAKYGSLGIKLAQEQARAAAVQTIGKTPEALKAAIAARTSVSDVNYKAAFNKATMRDKELREIWKNPYFKKEVGEAWELAQSKGLSPKENLTEFLQFVKEGLDAKIQSATIPGAPAISKSVQSARQDIKTRLVEWLGAKNPLYDKARLEHIAMSKPINQMKLGQEVQQAMSAPITGAERVSAFGAAVRKAENTISKATGQPRIKDLTEAQRKFLKAVEDSMALDATFKTAAKEGAIELNKRISAEVAPPTGLFMPILSAARSWTNRLLGTGLERGLNRLDPLMSNPQELARLMRAASPEQRKVIESLWAQRLTPPVAIGGLLSQESQ